MKRFLAAALLFAAGAFPAAAADNYQATEGSGKFFGCKDVGGICYPQWVPVDSTGAAFGVTGNPIFVVFPSAQAVTATLGAETTKVIGTVNQGTSPWIVGLPSGASTAALQTAGNTSLASILSALGSPFQAGGSIGNTTFAATQSGTWNITNISGTVTLPTGASTAAKQPALGTAGSASADVLSVQGIASMTPFLTNPGTAANWGIGTSTQNSASVANGQLGLAQFNTTPTTITNGNMSPLQMDSGGKLLVNCTGCSSSSAITSWGGGVLGAMANYGTSPGAVLVPGVNSFITNIPHVVCDSGCSGSGGTSSSYGSAFPAAGTAIGFSDGTNMVAGHVSTWGTAPTGQPAIAVNANVLNAFSPGQATPENSSPVVPAGWNYQTVVASQTGTALHTGGSGATGDYLSHCVAQPTSTSPGVLTIFDGTSSAANNVIAFPGGATSVSNLVAFSFPVGAFSVNGAWKVTTGADMTVTCYGNFS